MLHGTATGAGALDTIRLEYTTIFAHVLRWTAWLAWGSDSLAVDSYQRRDEYTSKGKWLVGEAVVHRVRPRLPCFEQRSAVGESCQSAAATRTRFHDWRKSLSIVHGRTMWVVMRFGSWLGFFPLSMCIDGRVWKWQAGRIRAFSDPRLRSTSCRPAIRVMVPRRKGKLQLVYS